MKIMVLCTSTIVLSEAVYARRNFVLYILVEEPKHMWSIFIFDCTCVFNIMISARY